MIARIQGPRPPRGRARSLQRTAVLGMMIGAALFVAAAIVHLVVRERAGRPPSGDAGTTAALHPPADLLARDLQFPVKGIAPASIADSFTDARGATRVHNAMDIMAPRGTAVLAVDAGTVSRLGKSGAGGITVYQLDQAGRYGFYYAHLDRLAAGLAEGQAVRRGDVLGYVGTTGNAPASAPHLHFAIYEVADGNVRWGGRPINPYPLWKRAAAD
jgi:murein DD-endopeptidase MepM/ murein hydrolase activator NlpD